MRFAVSLGRFGGLLGALVLLSCHDGAPGNPGNADVLWKVPSGSSISLMPLDPVATLDFQVVYFPTIDYRLKKIRGTDGHVIWDVDIGPQQGAFSDWNAVLSADVVAVSKVDVFAYDTTTGAHRWTYVAPDFDEVAYSGILADSNTIYAASRTARVYAIDARAGTARWIVDLRNGADVGALNARLADSTIYVCTHDYVHAPVRGTLWALALRDGQVRWKYDFLPQDTTGGAPSGCYGGSAFWNNLVIQPEQDGRVFALDRTTGAVRWIAPDDTIGPDIRYPAAFGDHLVVVSTSGLVIGLDPATGAERWRNDAIEGAPLVVPVADDKYVYIDYDWQYVAFDLATGQLHWARPPSTLDPATKLKGKPVSAPDRLYVAGLDGSYAVRK